MPNKNFIHDATLRFTGAFQNLALRNRKKQKKTSIIVTLLLAGLLAWLWFSHFNVDDSGLPLSREAATSQCQALCYRGVSAGQGRAEDCMDCQSFDCAVCVVENAMTMDDLEESNIFSRSITRCSITESLCPD
jgi:hypothetical protein